MLSSPFYYFSLFFFKAPPTTDIYTLSLHDALPIWRRPPASRPRPVPFPASTAARCRPPDNARAARCCGRWKRSEEHTSELQSRGHLVCRLLLEKKKKKKNYTK